MFTKGINMNRDNINKTIYWSLLYSPIFDGCSNNCYNKEMEKNDMKKLHVILIAATMSFALCACGTEATGSMSITETGEQQTQTKKPSYLELDKVLDEINIEIKQGTAGSGSTSIKVAAHLLNWGVDKAVK